MSNQEEILEGNKLLAEFEGYKYYEKTKVLGEYWFEDIEIYSNKPIKHISEEKENQYFNRFLQDESFEYKVCLSYNSDYNDLMRVWFKYDDIILIRNLLNNDSLLMDIYYEGNYDIMCALPKNSIDIVFKLLVREIKWLLEASINNEINNNIPNNQS